MMITQAILPVAGLGTRFLPWTKAVPKELLPIGRFPIIALLVDECLSVDITDICFVISPGKESIAKYFERDAALEAELERRGKVDALQEIAKYDSVRFSTRIQEKQHGDGHAILQAADWMKSDAVAILFGDDLVVGKENGLQQLARAYENIAKDAKRTPALLCLENVAREAVSRYGIVDVDAASSGGRLKRIRGLVEKPRPEEAPSTLGIIGKYIVPRSTFDVLPTVRGGKDGEIRLIDALITQLKDIPIYGYEAEGERLDTGTPEGYKEAVRVLG